MEGKVSVELVHDLAELFKDSYEFNEMPPDSSTEVMFDAFVVGYLAIAFFLRYLVTHTVTLFVVYRVVLGALVLVLASAGAIS